MSDHIKPRPPIAAMLKGPGPGKYVLPSTVGTSGHDATKRLNPAYSFGISLPNSIIQKSGTPGPAYFIPASLTRSGRDGTPSYTMGARFKTLAQFQNPAPGTYAPEKCPPLKERSAPAYSMGSRTQLRKRDTTPAPNNYAIKSTVGQAPAYSMTGRSKVGGFSEDLSKTPGAGAYTVPPPEIVDRKAPAFTMSTRTFMPSDTTKVPGPGAHSPEKVTATLRRAPAFSLGVKHSEYITPLVVDVAD